MRHPDNEVELKEIIPPRDIQQAMEKQMQAKCNRRASILTAEGDKRSSILKPRVTRRLPSSRPRASNAPQSCTPLGEAEAYRNAQATQIEMTTRLFVGLHDSDLSPEALRFLYLKTLPKIAKGPASKLFVFPSELQDLAGTIGALAGGVYLASEDSKTSGERRLSTKNGGLDGGA